MSIGEQLRTVHSNYDRFPIIVRYISKAGALSWTPNVRTRCPKAST